MRLNPCTYDTSQGVLGEGALPSGACAWAQPGLTDCGFTGQRNEASVGLMDFNARCYSPRLGRFVRLDSYVPDPTTGKGFNRYLYDATILCLSDRPNPSI